MAPSFAVLPPRLLLRSPLRSRTRTCSPSHRLLPVFLGVSPCSSELAASGEVLPAGGLVLPSLFRFLVEWYFPTACCTWRRSSCLFWIPAIPCLHSYCRSLGSLAPRPCHPPISEGLDVGPALGRGPGLGGHRRGRRVWPSFGRRALPCLGWLVPLVSGALHLGLASWPGPLGLLCGVALRGCAALAPRGCCGHWTLGPISRSSATSVKVTAVGHFFQARCAMDSRALRSRTSVEPIATQSESETCLCM